MSTINLHYAPPAGTGQNTNVPPRHSSPSASPPNPSPSSGPNWSTPPMQPVEGNGDKTVNELNALLTRENIEELMNNPDSDKSRAILAQLRPLMTQANISQCLQGPNAEKNAKMLEKIGERLDKSTLEASQNSCLKGLGDKYLQQAKFRNLEMLFKAFDAELGDFANFLSHSSENLKNLKARVFGTKANTQELNDFGGQLSKGKIERMRRQGPAGQS